MTALAIWTLPAWAQALVYYALAIVPLASGAGRLIGGRP